jgi:hypothetical protein
LLRFAVIKQLVSGGDIPALQIEIRILTYLQEELVLLLLHLLILLSDQLMQLAWQLPTPPFADGVGDVVCPEFQLSMVGQVALRKEKYIFNSAGILEQSMGARNLLGIGLSYWPTRLHWLAVWIPWNRFPGFLKV